MTKDLSNEIPNYKAIKSSLICMRDNALDKGVTRISIPKIGCGRDQLDWGRVKDILLKVFETTGILITVYTPSNPFLEKDPPVQELTYPNDKVAPVQWDDEESVQETSPKNEKTKVNRSQSHCSDSQSHYALSGDTLPGVSDNYPGNSSEMRRRRHQDPVREPKNTGQHHIVNNDGPREPGAPNSHAGWNLDPERKKNQGSTHGPEYTIPKHIAPLNTADTHLRLESGLRKRDPRQAEREINPTGRTYYDPSMTQQQQLGPGPRGTYGLSSNSAFLNQGQEVHRTPLSKVSTQQPQYMDEASYNPAYANITFPQDFRNNTGTRPKNRSRPLPPPHPTSPQTPGDRRYQRQHEVGGIEPGRNYTNSTFRTSIPPRPNASPPPPPTGCYLETNSEALIHHQNRRNTTRRQDERSRTTRPDPVANPGISINDGYDHPNYNSFPQNSTPLRHQRREPSTDSDNAEGTPTYVRYHDGRTNLNPNYQNNNISAQRDLDTLSTMLRDLRRSNKQMRCELEDIGDPLLRNSHQLTDHLRRKDKTTQFANEHNKKVISLETHLKKSIRNWGPQVSLQVRDTCNEALDMALHLDSKVIEASSDTAKRAREKGLTITTTGAGTNSQLYYPKFSEDSEMHLYEWLTKMNENFEIMNTDLSLRASILKDHLHGNAKLLVNESMKSEGEIKKALMDKFGDMHSIFVDLNHQHDKVGPIPSLSDRDPARIKEIVNKTSRHLNLIKRKELMLKYDGPSRGYETTLHSVSHFKTLQGLLPLELGADIYTSRTEDPTTAYSKIRDVFEKLQSKSGYLYEQLQVSTKHSSKKNVTMADTDKAKGRKQEHSEIILYSQATLADCRICDLQKAEGIGKEYYSNHVFTKAGTSHPSSCPNYLRLGMRGRRDFLNRHKICQFCLKPSDTKHKIPYDPCREIMLKGRQQGFKCGVPNCPQRKENCEIHKTNNLPKLENRAKILKTENNIDFIFMGQEYEISNGTDIAIYKQKSCKRTQDPKIFLLGSIQGRPATKHDEVMDTSNSVTSEHHGFHHNILLPNEGMSHEQVELASIECPVTTITPFFKYPPVPSLQVKYRIKHSPLKTFLESQKGDFIDDEIFTLGDVLDTIKTMTIRDGLFDPNNDSIIFCSKQLEAIVNMKVIHISQVRKQILPQMIRLPEQLELQENQNPPSLEVSDDEKFLMPLKLSSIIQNNHWIKYEKDLAHLQEFKFPDILNLTTSYIKSHRHELFEERNPDVAIVKNSPLCEILGVHAFHKHQLVFLLKKILIPVQKPPTVPQPKAPTATTSTKLQTKPSWPSPSQTYSSVTKISHSSKPSSTIYTRGPGNAPDTTRKDQHPYLRCAQQDTSPRSKIEGNGSRITMRDTPKAQAEGWSSTICPPARDSITDYLMGKDPRTAPTASNSTICPPARDSITDYLMGKDPRTAPNASNSTPLLWKGAHEDLTRLISEAGPWVEDPPVGKATLLFMYTKGKTRPLATLFDTGCTTSLVREDVLGTEIIATELKKEETTLIGFGGQTKPLDKYAFYLHGLDERMIRMEGHAVDTIINIKTQDTTKALHHIKLDSAISCISRSVVHRAEVYPTHGGEVDIVIGMNYIKYFPDLVFRSSLDLSLFRLKLKSHSPKYMFCLGGNNPWGETTCISNPYKASGILSSAQNHRQQSWQESMKTFIDRGEVSNHSIPSTDSYATSPMSDPIDKFWYPSASIYQPPTSETPALISNPAYSLAAQVQEIPLHNLMGPPPSFLSIPPPMENYTYTNPREALSPGKMKNLKRTMKNELNPGNQTSGHEGLQSLQDQKWDNENPARFPQARPIFIGSYQFRQPDTPKPSVGQLLRKGSRIPSLNYFQTLLRGKTRPLLTLFSPQHCGILVRNDILGDELDFEQLTQNTVNVFLPHTDGSRSRANAHRMPHTIEVKISNREDAFLAMYSPGYQQSSQPHKTQPHLDGAVDLIIGFTAKRYHPKPILIKKTGIKVFVSCLEPYYASFKYCAEGLYSQKGYCKTKGVPPGSQSGAEAQLNESLTNLKLSNSHFLYPIPSPPSNPTTYKQDQTLQSSQDYCMILESDSPLDQEAKENQQLIDSLSNSHDPMPQALIANSQHSF